MNLNEFAKEIHENAKAHGFWDKPDTFDKICADIISELSEALREYEAGRPMEWYSCPMSRKPCNGNCGMVCDPMTMRPKPEGIAVEMADCAIWILDYLGSVGRYDIDTEVKTTPHEPAESFPETFMNATHFIVKASNRGEHSYGRYINLTRSLMSVMDWFEANNLDFEAIARRKHEYNKTRERLHGKLF